PGVALAHRPAMRIRPGMARMRAAVTPVLRPAKTCSMIADLAPETTRRIELADAAATESLARTLAREAGPGDVIALWGDLGAGKTHFARAFIGALSRRRGGTPECDPDNGGEEVPSPTFTLVQTYDTAAGTVWHFDL